MSESASDGIEQFGWLFEDRTMDSTVLVVGSGDPEFWERYGERVTVVSWTLDGGRDA